MTNNPTLLRKEFEVNSFMVNFKGQLGLFAMLNALQDAAWDHANRLGFGYETIQEQSMIWALTRQKLVIKRWPKWGEKITVETWIRPSDTLTLREFQVLVGNEIIGESTTSWLTLNGETRRPAKLDKSMFKDYNEERSLPFISEKIFPLKEYTKLLAFHVRNSDIDVNRHVNNTRYAQWILDSIPQKWHRDYVLNEYEVNFLAETKLGEEIQICTNHELKSSEKTRWSTFQGIRTSDLKVVFTARLLITETERT